MKTRDVYITSAETLTDSGTRTYPLSPLGRIQQIRLRFVATNGATSNTVGKLKHWVSKIEVVDGSDALHSVSGLEEFALNCFHNDVSPPHNLSGGAGVVITDEVVIEFGRFIGDREFYLDCSRYKNPLLRITWAFTVSATAGIATGTGTFSAIARTIEDGALPYKGFIMRKEVLSWTTAASGTQSAILDLSYPYAGLLIGALKTTISPDTILTNFKLSRNTDQYIDFNLSGAEMYDLQQHIAGPFRQKFRPLADTAFTWLGDMYYKTGAWMSRPAATAKGITTAVAAESVTGAMTTGGTADALEAELEGLGPAASAYYPFGLQQNPDDYLNPSGLGELKLILTQGVVSAAGTVVTEQLRV